MQSEDYSVPGEGSPGFDVVRARAAETAAKGLTRTQKRFKQLLQRLNEQRRELARWTAFRSTFDRHIQQDYQPWAARLREKRIALAILLDHATDGGALRERERDKVRDILRKLLSGLLSEAADPILIRIHDKHAAVSFAEQLQDRMDAVRAYASQTFGVDTEGYEGEQSPEDLADWLGERVRAAKQNANADADADANADADSDDRAGAKKGAKALAKDALRERAIEDGARAVRETFRKLVSELHPDRESDTAERIRKTELMQRVNIAYDAGDLFALLELQISVARVDPGTLASQADERLRRYIQVLEKQSAKMRDDIAALIEPFAAAAGVSARKITPDRVLHALQEDVRELKGVLRGVEADLIRFKNISRLKESLGSYRIGSLDDDDPELGDLRPFDRGLRRRRP